MRRTPERQKMTRDRCTGKAANNESRGVRARRADGLARLAALPRQELLEALNSAKEPGSLAAW